MSEYRDCTICFRGKTYVAKKRSNDYVTPGTLEITLHDIFLDAALPKQVVAVCHRFNQNVWLTEFRTVEISKGVNNGKGTRNFDVAAYGRQ